MSVINGVTVLEAPGWKPQKTVELAAVMTNGNGEKIGDYVRTRYILSYAWPYLSDALRESLDTALDPETDPTFSVTHPIPGAAESYTGTYRVTSPLQAENLTRDGEGNIVWGAVTLTLEEV